jgi:hypothetical protein
MKHIPYPRDAAKTFKVLGAKQRKKKKDTFLDD